MAGEPSLSIWTEEALPASYSESTTSTSRVPRCLTGMAGTVEAGAHATATTAPTASPAASLTRPLFVRSPGKAALIVYTASGTGRSEERRVGKSVDLGGRRIIKKKI